MNSREVLNVAKVLLGIEVKESESLIEAENRSAISRAYYAAFNVCKELVEIMADDFPDPHSHRPYYNIHYEVPEHLKSCSTHEAFLMARKLKELRIARNDADYNINSPKRDFNSMTAENYVEEAQEFIEYIDSLLSHEDYEGFKNRMISCRTLFLQKLDSI